MRTSITSTAALSTSTTGARSQNHGLQRRRVRTRLTMRSTGGPGLLRGEPFSRARPQSTQSLSAYTPQSWLEGRGKKTRAYIGVIDLSGTQVTDAELEKIGQLPELTRLKLNDTSKTDVGIWHLGKLPALKQIELSGSRISEHVVSRSPRSGAF